MIRKEAAILHHLRRRGPLTRTALAEYLRMPKPTLVRLSNELFERGLIRDVGQVEAGRGRPPQLLDINPAFGSLVGVEIRMNQIIGVACDLQGELFAEQILPLELIDDEQGEQRLIEAIAQVVSRLLAVVEKQPPELRGIGIAVPGQLDTQQGLVITFPHLRRWRNVPLAKLLSRRFKLPCLLQPNSVASAMGEHEYGGARGLHNVLCITVNENVGMGVILDGQVMSGATGNIGELGHIRVPDTVAHLAGNIPCYCGSIGCVETRLSKTALEANARRALGGAVDSAIAAMVDHELDRVDFDTIVAAARQGDKLAHAIMHEFASFLGRVLAVAVNLFNPERIILGGVLAEVSDLILAPAQHSLRLHALEFSAARTEIVFSEMSDRAAALGATVPLVDRVLGDV